jgi:hypothetical protein
MGCGRIFDDSFLAPEVENSRHHPQRETNNNVTAITRCQRQKNKGLALLPFLLSH